ncbi:hypothetical protein TWF217_007126 [Orbilia oligospora]|nr:hypothetical protein TWF217_007126 [Orbilia oligospora]
MRLFVSLSSMAAQGKLFFWLQNPSLNFHGPLIVNIDSRSLSRSMASTSSPGTRTYLLAALCAGYCNSSLAGWLRKVSLSWIHLQYHHQQFEITPINASF